MRDVILIHKKVKLFPNIVMVLNLTAKMRRTAALDIFDSNRSIFANFKGNPDPKITP
jgi:hypothetical protein